VPIIQFSDFELLPENLNKLAIGLGGFAEMTGILLTVACKSNGVARNCRAMKIVKISVFEGTGSFIAPAYSLGILSLAAGSPKTI
jgi:hypothetical protein